METTVRKICCQGCGATLPVEDGVRYLTCNYCDARLEVVSNAATSHTRLLEEIGDRTDRIERKLDAIRARDEIARLDRAWEDYAAAVSFKRGGRSHPPSVEAAMGHVAIGGFLTLIACLILAQASWWWVPPAALAGALLTRHFHRMERLRAEAFGNTRRRYERRRKELEDML